MSFSGNYICTSFKQELLEVQHDFRVGGHTFKLALYTDSASFTAATTDYTATNEVSGTGYSAGGITLTQVAPSSSGTTGLTDFADITLSNATLTAHGGLIYNTTAGGGVGTTNAIAILDFGRDITKTAQDFVITFPTADALNAIIRVN